MYPLQNTATFDRWTKISCQLRSYEYNRRKTARKELFCRFWKSTRCRSRHTFDRKHHDFSAFPEFGMVHSWELKNWCHGNRNALEPLRFWNLIRFWKSCEARLKSDQILKILWNSDQFLEFWWKTKQIGIPETLAFTMDALSLSEGHGRTMTRQGSRIQR